MFQQSSPGSRLQRKWQPTSSLGVKYCICLSASVRFCTRRLTGVPIATVYSWLANQVLKKLAKSSSLGTCLTSAVVGRQVRICEADSPRNLKLQKQLHLFTSQLLTLGKVSELLYNMYCYHFLWSSVIPEPSKLIWDSQIINEGWYYSNFKYIYKKVTYV